MDKLGLSGMSRPVLWPTFRTSRNSLQRSDLINNLKDDLRLSSSKKHIPFTKKMWEIMLHLDGPTFAVLC